MTNVIFQVIGNGSMYIEVNQIPKGSVQEGFPITINLVNGNVLGIFLTPFSGSTLVNLCDVPQTECQTALSYLMDITNDAGLPQKMVATFTAAQQVGYNCSDCNTPVYNGTYQTSAQCQAACAPQCPKGDRYLKPIGGSCDPGYSEEWHPFQNECVCDATKAPAWQELAIYAVAGLGIAYILGNVLRR